MKFWGVGAGVAEGAIAPPMFLEIDKILAFSITNIFRSKESAVPKNVISTPNILHLLVPL